MFHLWQENLKRVVPGGNGQGIPHLCMDDVPAPNRLKELRDEREWSQATLAERVVPPTTSQQIGNLERGDRRLTPDWMRKLAAALECHPLEILYSGPELLNYEEQELLEIYRNLDDKTKTAMMVMARAIQPKKSTG